MTETAPNPGIWPNQESRLREIVKRAYDLRQYRRSRLLAERLWPRAMSRDERYWMGFYAAVSSFGDELWREGMNWMLRAPDGPQLAALRAYGYARLGDEESSKNAAVVALGHSTNEPCALHFALHTTAEAALARFDLPDALRLGQAAVKTNPGCGTIFDTLGNIHMRLGNLLKAEDLIRKSLRAYPDDPLHHVSLIRVLIIRGQIEEAIRTLGVARPLIPKCRYLGGLAALLRSPADRNRMTRAAASVAEGETFPGHPDLIRACRNAGIRFRPVRFSEDLDFSFTQAVYLNDNASLTRIRATGDRPGIDLFLEGRVAGIR